MEPAREKLFDVLLEPLDVDRQEEALNVEDDEALVGAESAAAPAGAPPTGRRARMARSSRSFRQTFCLGM